MCYLTLQITLVTWGNTVDLMRRAEKAAADVKTTISASVIVSAVALLVAVVALVVAVRR